MRDCRPGLPFLVFAPRKGFSVGNTFNARPGVLAKWVESRITPWIALFLAPQQVCAQRLPLSPSRPRPIIRCSFMVDLGLVRHLLHAMETTLKPSSGARILLVSSEVFMNDFINSIRDDKTVRSGALPPRRLPADRRHSVPAGRSRRSRSSSTPSTRCTTARSRWSSDQAPKKMARLRRADAEPFRVGLLTDAAAAGERIAIPAKRPRRNG